MEAAPFDHSAALIACARGEQSAFHRLFDHEGPHMLALCRHLAPDDPEGLCHDTFAILWRNADQFDPQMGSARAWIYSVLRHLARARRMRTQPGLPSSAPTLPAPSSLRGPLSALASVSGSRAYTAVAHGYLHGADYVRIATWLNCSEGQLRRDTRAQLKGMFA